MYSQLVTKSRNTPINSQQSKTKHQHKHKSWRKTVGSASYKGSQAISIANTLDSFSRNQKSVLEVLIESAAKYEMSFPSHAFIADHSDVSVSTVQRSIKELVDLGLLYYINRIENHCQESNQYFLNMGFFKGVDRIGRCSFLKGLWDLLKKTCMVTYKAIPLMMSELTRPTYKFFEECDKDSYAAPWWAVT